MLSAPTTTLPVATPLPEPFEDFYRREYRSVVALAISLSGNRGAAEDLAQEAFLAAHRHWAKVSGYDAPGAWVRKVVVNKSRSAFRRTVTEAKAMVKLRGGQQITSVDKLPHETDAFWQAVRKLPKRQAQCVALRYLEDLPIEEIARILECSNPTVRVHLHRARAALAEQLGIDVEDYS